MTLLERFKNFTTGTPRRVFVSFFFVTFSTLVVLLVNTKLQRLAPKAEDRLPSLPGQANLQEEARSEGGQLVISKPSGIKRPEDIAKYEPSDREFIESEIGTKTVYYHQRTIDGAIVEKDFINYQFDRETEEFLEKKSRWRPDLPEQLPPLKITKEQAMSMVEGDPQFANLYIISPDSDVFPLDPRPENPCWVVNSVGNDSVYIVTIIDAVTGEIPGYGVPPPSNGFSISGPHSFEPCQGDWTAWYTNAKDWFEDMGYPTEALVWPTIGEMEDHLRDPETILFYEVAHGDWERFKSGCGRQTRAVDVKEWLSERERIPFTFLGGCSGMCQTGKDTLSYEFRKGLMQDTVTVGYCGFTESKCSVCWDYAVDWQDAMFDDMYNGATVKTAFENALADYPSCGEPNNCMRFVGDAYYKIGSNPMVSELTYPPSAFAIGGEFYIRGTAEAIESSAFTNYVVDYTLGGAEEWSTDGITLLNGGGTQPVVNGNLAVWDTSALSSGFYRLRLRVFAGVSQKIASTTVTIDTTLTGFHLGWPAILEDGVWLSPVVISNVNGDAAKEMVFRKGSKLYVYQHNGDLLWSKDASSGYPVLWDIDPNFAGKEIITQFNSSQVIAWHGDGSVVDGWPKDVGPPVGDSGPVIEDLDSDGNFEIIVPSNQLYVLDESGNELWNQNVFALYFPGDLPAGSQYAAATADLTGDGRKEIVLRLWRNFSQSTQIMVLDGTTGEPALGWEEGPLELTSEVQDSFHTALGDIDGDGAFEMVVASRSVSGSPGVTNTFVIRGDKTFLDGWAPKAFPFEECDRWDRTSQLVLADLNSDTVPEIVHLGYEGCILAIDPSTGETLPGFEGEGLGTMGSYAAVGDINNDGNKEFVSNGRVGVRGDNKVGFTVSSYNAETSSMTRLKVVEFCEGICPEWETQDAAFADLDGDGKTEIIIPYLNWIYVFDSNETTGFLDWPQYLHDERHTGAYTVASCIPESLLPGDLDCDCDVDIVDIMMVAAIWNTKEGDDKFKPGFDFDGDGRITVVDIMYIAAKWNTQCP